MVNKKTTSRFFELIKEYWLIIIAGILLIPYILRYIQKQDVKQLEANAQAEIDKLKVENSDPVKQQANANSITTNAGYQKIAHDVAYHLGVNFAWYDPRGWTENDSDAFNLLKNLNSGQLKIVGTLYNKVYATGRNLKDDCQLLFSFDYYKQLKF